MMEQKRLCWRAILKLLAAVLAATFRGGKVQAANWWTEAYTGLADAATRAKCRTDVRITELPSACIVAHDLMKPVLHQAVRKGVDQCALVFAEHRYNCTVNPNTPSLFGRGITRGTHRESAFVHALLAASVSHGVARACSAGQLGDMCTCAAGKLGGVKRKVKVDWEWGGCSDDIGFGRKVAAALVKKSRTELSRRRKIHLHNFNAGSLIASQVSVPRCKCYGTSGSCSLRSCHVSQAPTSTIAGKLWAQYKRAVEVNVKRKPDQTWKLRQPGEGRPAKTAFVYNMPSPSYCTRNAALGYPGTRGRRCFTDKTALSSCERLCCGRGHRTLIVKVTRNDCHCRYEPFPRYVCDTCVRDTQVHYCN